ncbi:hypothetical protein Rsub_09475 [Raphidocelis subcapitata]|uniref:Arrestin-like N-terminal domain-containing protein n=1 Tax=Raphidocelis subcapitata TaxID=307507 RepID=A0A2V0PFR1_9CHLO|nr:hypothetical protein Rsub_09475 [Raphidocelis subcapitata]|eukprot:GBF96733.1 hypothetical protein Rsub_09475 [Raphidocelis subcapitata]
MGAGQSAQAHVLLDRRAWAQGDAITGSVVFNTSKPVPYHSVVLKFVGKERTHWEVRHYSKNGSHTTRYDGKAKIIKAVMPLLTGPGTLGVGGHRMPFVVSLPAGLPPSFSFQDGPAKASVVYQVKVEVDQAGVFAKDFKASAALDLLPRPPRAPAPLRGAAEQPVRGCCGCCCDYGQVALLLESPADAVAAGATVPLTVRVDNASSEAVTAAASLVRTVRLKSLGVLGDSTWQREAAVAQKALKPEGAASGGAGRGGRRGGNELQVAAAGTATCRDALPIAPDAMASMVGGTQLIAVWYELRVDAAATGCCLSGARVACPLLVSEAPAALQHRSAAPPPAPPKAPAGWIPQDHGASGFTVARDGAARRVRVGEIHSSSAAAAGAAPFGSLAPGGAAAFAAAAVPSATAGWTIPAGGELPAGAGAAGAPPSYPSIAAPGTHQEPPPHQSYPGYPALGAAQPVAAAPEMHVPGPGAFGAAAPTAAAGGAVMQVPGPGAAPQGQPGW